MVTGRSGAAFLDPISEKLLIRKAPLERDFN